MEFQNDISVEQNPNSCRKSTVTWQLQVQPVFIVQFCTENHLKMFICRSLVDSNCYKGCLITEKLMKCSTTLHINVSVCKFFFMAYY